jgi:hypothetical protein
MMREFPVRRDGLRQSTTANRVHRSVELGMARMSPQLMATRSRGPHHYPHFSMSVLTWRPAAAWMRAEEAA